MAKPRVISEESGDLILLLLNTHSPFLVGFLRSNGYAASEAHSPDHLVALCLNNPATAVIVDVCQLGEIEGWSVAQSIKMVKPSLSVILLCHGAIPEKVELPTAVDALASDSDLQGLLMVLDKHTAEKKRSTQLNAGD
jgi:DNA-binding NtrC family response regulator